MTGEMSKADVTKEAYPLHFLIARKYASYLAEVLPFDQYQGPYVFVPGKGKFWLCVFEDGPACYWYSEQDDSQSRLFHPDARGQSTREFTRAFGDMFT